MTLSKHIKVEALELAEIKKSSKLKLGSREDYVGSYTSNELVPKYAIPDESVSSTLVHKILNEELSLDGNPTLNLASFVNTEYTDTHMEIIKENVVKNLADNDEYPSLIEFQNRCITILSNLWHAPHIKKGDNSKKTKSIGTATTGSSEAIILAGLALKKRWQEKRRQQGKDTSNPNILMASCCHVSLEKFATYFDVENRLIPITAESGHLIDTTKIKENIDENTIGIYVILGSTFTGAFEPVEYISKLLDEVEAESGHDVRIHVDGASGAFVAPFVYPSLKWDFLIDRVDSINTSGHKFGLTTSGLGWVIWKDTKLLPKSLKFSLDYLGGQEETFGINFSRPGFPVVLQYYNFLRLGREGYTKLHDSSLANARLLSNLLVDSGYFNVLSVIHKPVKKEDRSKFYTLEHDEKDYSQSNNEEFEPGLPVVAFSFSDEFKKDYPEIPQTILSSLLRKQGYIVPNYHLPPDEKETEILRVVVRTSFSTNLLDKLVTTIIEFTELLMEAVDNARAIGGDSRDGKTRAADKDIIQDILKTLASAGEASVAAIIEEDKEEKDAKDKKSYRGAC